MLWELWKKEREKKMDMRGSESDMKVTKGNGKTGKWGSKKTKK